MSVEDNHILEFRSITKEFPGVKALDTVSMSFRYGEVHAFCGENGAGKSTLMKILSGVYQPTSGELFYKGQKKIFKNPHQAQLAGISIIFQEFSLIRNFDVVKTAVGYTMALCTVFITGFANIEQAFQKGTVGLEF